MAYTAPLYNAVDFTAVGGAYTAPLYNLVDFQPTPEVAGVTVTGDGTLRGLVGIGYVSTPAVIEGFGVGTMRRLKGAGIAHSGRSGYGDGTIGIKGIGQEIATVVVGDGLIGIKGVGVARDHVC